MSSSEEDDIVVAYLYLKKRNRQNKKRFWVHPHYVKNICYSTFIVSRELDQDPEKFHGYYRMNPKTFKILVSLVETNIRKKDTNFRQSVGVEERLLITLR